MLKNFLIISVFLLLCIPSLYVCSYADIQSELASKNKQLSRMKEDINKKKAEKERLVKEEQTVSKELKKISYLINKTERQLRNLEVKIKQTEENINSASDKYSSAGSSKIQYLEQIKKESVLYNKNKMTAYFRFPADIKIRKVSLAGKAQNYRNAKSDEETARDDITNYSRQKEKLTKLRNEQSALKQQNMKLQKDKNELLKTTAGKRIKAEQEIKDLNDTAQAMQELVNKLTVQSKKKHPITSARSNTNTRRNNLPWPVDGTVVVGYGKNKHPALNTTVISNGIKIKAKNNDIIKAVDDGVVVFAGFFRSYGKMVIVDHKGIYFSVYGQLNRIFVKENSEIKKGENIANLGADDASVLYFEIRQYNVPENPLLWLKEKK